jgi:hypothetical protein
MQFNVNDFIMKHPNLLGLVDLFPAAICHATGDLGEFVPGSILHFLTSICMAQQTLHLGTF